MLIWIRIRKYIQIRYLCIEDIEKTVNDLKTSFQAKLDESQQTIDKMSEIFNSLEQNYKDEKSNRSSDNESFTSTIDALSKDKE